MEDKCKSDIHILELKNKCKDVNNLCKVLKQLALITDICNGVNTHFV